MIFIIPIEKTQQVGFGKEAQAWVVRKTDEAGSHQCRDYYTKVYTSWSQTDDHDGPEIIRVVSPTSAE